MGTTDTKPSIGFIGLGNMGGPMARRLAQAGYDVSVFDINANAFAQATDAGATAAASGAGVRSRP